MKQGKQKKPIIKDHESFHSPFSRFSLLLREQLLYTDKFYTKHKDF